MHKFLLAENPLAPDSSGVFLLHALPPFALIRAEQGQVRLKTGAVFCQYAFRNSIDQVEDWTLFIHHLEAGHEDAAKLLDKAWRWYRAYMEWEDKQFENE